MIPAEEFYGLIAANIERTGRHVMGVFGDPAFAYSIGNSLRNLPELLVVGLDPKDGMMLINHWSALMIERGREFDDHELIDIGGKFPCAALHCLPAVKSQMTIQAGEYLGHQRYRVTQVLVPDKAGRFPWNAGCDEPYRRVPLFGRAPS